MDLDFGLVHRRKKLFITPTICFFCFLFFRRKYLEEIVLIRYNQSKFKEQMQMMKGQFSLLQ